MIVIDQGELVWRDDGEIIFNHVDGRLPERCVKTNTTQDVVWVTQKLKKANNNPWLFLLALIFPPMLIMFLFPGVSISVKLPISEDSYKPYHARKSRAYTAIAIGFVSFAGSLILAPVEIITAAILMILFVLMIVAHLLLTYYSQILRAVDLDEYTVSLVGACDGYLEDLKHYRPS